MLALLDLLVAGLLAEDLEVAGLVVVATDLSLLGFRTGFLVTARVALFAFACTSAPDLAIACNGCGRYFGFLGTLLSAGKSATRLMIAA